MPQNSPRLTLPFIQPAQAQKHVTHNEALRVLDLLVQLSLQDDQTQAPPAAPQEGDCYIVPAGASEDWAGHSTEIAAYLDGTWSFISPRPGWRGYVVPRASMVLFDGSSWRDAHSDLLQNTDLLGLGMSADAATPFAAKLNAALWTALYTADGGTGSIMQTLNKQGAAQDAGWVLQDNFETRALIGLFGDNRLRLSVTPDGSSFYDGLSIDPSTGVVDQPHLPRFKASLNYDQLIAEDTWTIVAMNTAEINDQGHFDPAGNAFVAPVDGTYMLGGTLHYKKHIDNAHLSARMMINNTDEIAGSRGRMNGTHFTMSTSIWPQTMVQLTAGDSVTLQCMFKNADAYVAADRSVFWGHKIG